ncbi:14 kDa proline-rich protein DC2.15 [Amborella trichopoda]|uniref:Bifunctional inhibitor/plant lipid transfer protein/seed storage helical domain-containing protein n=1 Tax=Amborella trichopoda TaxID=13333 RepID=W1PLN4_AMBTC|nr:14 kDa proline-rich protein DC2.15 [Amborella trichopoda]ERN08953.1 hypothetical protein AMTR_s01045p00008470 [Amborella trichopoda]|eukprot:XP_006847372.1 14 kDa proline-rich protein DC2.15 [Amborella trichopoda]
MTPKVFGLVLLTLNLFFFAYVTSNCLPCSPLTPKDHHHKPSPSAPSVYPYCPKDTLKLAVCADVLDGVAHLVIGGPSWKKCCSLLDGLVDLDSAVCLCTALKANILGIKHAIDVALSLLVNTCGKKLPKGFKCA